MPNLQTIIEENEKEFDEKFARKNIVTGKYEDKWLVRETVTSGELKSFLLSSQTNLIKEVIENIGNMKNHNEMLEMAGIKYTEGFEEALQKVIDYLKEGIKV